jgi:hypothetical protein
MTNLFKWDYIEIALKNLDGTKSNFRQVFGMGGQNVICPRSTYHIVKTADVSALGQAFIDKGFNVTTFSHRDGESIGLKITFGRKPSKVGESRYYLIITIPNNGSGKGYYAIMQERLICLNGMVTNQTMYKDNYVKIPHTIDYNDSLILMKKSIESFLSLQEQLQERDEAMNGQELTYTEIMFNLNKWFYDYEMPTNHKKEMTFDEFRKALAIDPNQIDYIHRYNELKEAYNRELGYNKELGLKSSMYTVYASVTNYLSRRVEKSQGKASNEVKFERASKKLVYFDN